MHSRQSIKTEVLWHQTLTHSNLDNPCAWQLYIIRDDSRKRQCCVGPRSGNNKILLFRMAQERKKFCKEEDEAILQVIASGDNYKDVKGQPVWKEVAKHKDLQGHPPTACRNRFLRIIMKDLDSYDITEEFKNKVTKVVQTQKKRGKRMVDSRKGQSCYSIEDDMKIIEHMIDQNNGSWRSSTYWMKSELKLNSVRLQFVNAS